jgi:hypothetical protein
VLLEKALLYVAAKVASQHTVTGIVAKNTGGGHQCSVDSHLTQSEITQLEREAEFTSHHTATKKVLVDGAGIKDVKSCWTHELQN